MSEPSATEQGLAKMGLTKMGLTGTAQRNIVQHGEWIVDADTGEIIDLASIPVEEAPFMVCDQASAEWVLERLFEAESELAAVIGRRAILNENLDRMEAEAQRRVDWLRWRFGPELEMHAEVELEGKKTRSIKTPFGTLSFRRKPARVKVTDAETAVKFLESVGIEGAVKVSKTVLVSKLPPSFPAAESPGFEVEPESESFTIKTGLL